MVFIHGYSYPFPIESSTQKNFTKKQFDVTPVGKPETASWENFISLLEKYFFSIGKLFFFSWALSEAHFDAFLFVFDLLWLLSMNTKNVLRFHFCFDKRKLISRLSIVSASSACHCPKIFPSRKSRQSRKCFLYFVRFARGIMPNIKLVSDKNTKGHNDRSQSQYSY